MDVDYLTLACLRDRLDGLLGARVQRVVLPDRHSVGLELYAGRRFRLLISAHPQQARMLLVPHQVRRGVETETPLLLLLRKWVRSARLVDVTQPEWERILTLHFKGPVGSCRLVAELIGRYSNLILVGPDGNVLEAVKQVGPDVNRYRVTLPAHPYQPPPIPPGRRPPIQMTAGEFAALQASTAPDEPLHRLLTQNLLGVGPMLAREIAARAAGDPQAPARAAPPAAVVAAVTDLFAPVFARSAWHPHIALDTGGDVIAFAPYRPRQFERVEPTCDINEALGRYFEARLTADPYAAARQRVQEMIDAARSRIQHALDQVQSQRVDKAAVNELRQSGELLLAYQNRVTRGAHQVTVPGHAGQPRTIPLNPALTPVENAQDYFRRYQKAARSGEEITARTAELTTDRAYVEQLQADLALAESRPEIDAVREALVEAGWASRPRRSAGGQVRAEGPRRFEIDGFAILVGRNARQNEQITFRQAAPDDLWLHVRGQPGAHVILKRGGRDVPEEVLLRAAELAAYYSPARGEASVSVDVTERRHVQRIAGQRPGLVSYRNERTATVSGGLDPDQFRSASGK
ncbi:MAG TPA: fibronectin-binding domain-containing protein [Chloroflexi bacterium]|nr:fibronectin-binding domain-containing protein [Chloroflexota bacterium]